MARLRSKKRYAYPVILSRRLNLRLNPSRIIILAFLATVLFGAFLLTLPVSRSGASEDVVFQFFNNGLPSSATPNHVHTFGPSFPGGAPLSVALFTAASATSVTGLIVVDTASYWSPFGQAVILTLIELGGIGTMTIVSLVALNLRGASSETRELASTSLGGAPVGSVKRTVRNIIWFSLALQLVFALILSLHLGLSGITKNPREAIFHGLFLTGSAFNNAGFALNGDSLMSFRNDPIVLLSLALLIIVGGIGFPVWSVLAHRGPHWWKLNMNARIMLVGTLAAILAGWVLIAALEWDNPGTLGPENPGSKLLNAFFASVSPRTAGFNSMDIAAQSPETWLVTDILMLIGGGPAGTAGGLKITTVTVVIATLWGEVRGAEAINILGLRLARSAQRQALAVFSLFAVLVGVASFLLMLATPYTLNQSLYEVSSAIATVGLSTGITPSLPVKIQFMLALLMMVGRLGPLTLATAIGTRRRKIGYELPKDRPLIG